MINSEEGKFRANKSARPIALTCEYRCRTSGYLKICNAIF